MILIVNERVDLSHYMLTLFNNHNNFVHPFITHTTILSTPNNKKRINPTNLWNDSLFIWFTT